MPSDLNAPRFRPCLSGEQKAYSFFPVIGVVVGVMQVGGNSVLLIAYCGHVGDPRRFCLIY